MTTPPHFPDRQIPQPPATIQPTVGYASIISPMPSGWTAVTDRRIQTLEADIARLIRERDAARAECRAWRKWSMSEPWTYDALESATAAHDAACPGWEEAN
jgi:hypothetical protein